MKKVAAAIPKDSPVKYDVDRWSNKDGSGQHDLIFLKTTKRDDLEKFLATLTGELALPVEREWGYEETAKNSEGEAAPEKGWEVYLLKKRTLVTGEYLANASEGWDNMNRPVVEFQMDRKGSELMGRLTGENVGRMRPSG